MITVVIIVIRLDGYADVRERLFLLGGVFALKARRLQNHDAFEVLSNEIVHP